MVLIKPSVGVATGEAYSALDALPDRRSANATARWPGGSPSNDFESVIYDLYPEIAAARDALIAAGAETTLLCGSGATVLGMGQDMEAIAARVRAAQVGSVWVTRTVSASGDGS
jgi:4-diphosphocytidyl-2-C-methyl-D-erythritol kinase